MVCERKTVLLYPKNNPMINLYRMEDKVNIYKI